MKKVLFLLPLTLLFMFAVVSCGDGNAKAVYEKIEKGQTLDKADYEVMDNYMLDAVNEMEKIIKKSSLADLMQQDGAAAKELDKKYPYADKFGQELQKAEASGKYESKAVKKLMELFSSMMPTFN